MRVIHVPGYKALVTTGQLVKGKPPANAQLNVRFTKMKKKGIYKEHIDNDYVTEIEQTYQAEVDDFLNSIDIDSVLKGVDVNVNEQKLIWPDGSQLTIDESASKIKSSTGFDIQRIKGTIVAWLEMGFIPKGLDQKEMMIFEKKIKAWVSDYF